MASSGDNLIYFLVGGFVGASVALLLAPRSGEETRDLLGDRYREGTERIGETFRSGREAVADKSRGLADRASEAIDRGRDTLTGQKERLAATVIQAGRQTYEEENQQLQESEKSDEPQEGTKPRSSPGRSGSRVGGSSSLLPRIKPKIKY